MSGEGGSAFGSAVGGSRSQVPERGTQRLAAVVFGALVVASFVAFGLTQRLKHTPPAVGNFKMTPFFAPTRARAHSCLGRVSRGLILAHEERIEYVSFKLSQANLVTVAVVNAAGGEEARLVRELPVERYKQVSLCWNGHRGNHQRGALAPPGEYRLRVSLERGGHTPVYSPRSFALRAAGR